MLSASVTIPQCNDSTQTARVTKCVLPSSVTIPHCNDFIQTAIVTELPARVTILPCDDPANECKSMYVVSKWLV